MRRLCAIAVVSVSLLFTSCSNDIKVEPDQTGQCVRTTKDKFIGITYSTSRNRVGCVDGDK